MTHRADDRTEPRGWGRWVRRLLRRGGALAKAKGHGQDARMVGRRWRHALIAVITGVWVVQFFANVFGDFSPDATVNAAFLIVAGAVLGVDAVRGKSNNDGGPP